MTRSPAGTVPARLRAEAALAVQDVVHVNDLAHAVRAHRHAAAHVDDDQVQRIVGGAVLLGVAAGHRLLVQRVEDAAPRQLRHAGNAGHVGQLVHHHRVNDVAGLADGVADLPRQDAAQVGGMLALDALFQVGQQLVADGVGAAGDGLEQAAAADDDVQRVDVAVFLLQKVQDDLLAEILLVDDGGVLGDLLGGMAQRFLKQQRLVLEHADLGGGGTGIDDQAFDRHGDLLLFHSRAGRLICFSSWPRPPRRPERWS